MTWKLYIIQAKSGKLYTGITTDLKRRFIEHLNNKRGAKFFHFSEPDFILYEESFLNRAEASKREYQIKKMSRKKKLELIASIIQK